MVQITQRRRQRQQSHVTTAAVSIGLLIALLSIGLAACSSVLGGPPPPTQPPVQQCGTVHTLGPHVVAADQAGAKQAEDCLWQAFQECLPATFVFVMGSVDTVLTRTFTVETDNKGNCSLSDMRQFRMLPSPPEAPKTYLCKSMIEKTDGLHFSGCNVDGDIFAPVA